MLSVALISLAVMSPWPRRGVSTICIPHHAGVLLRVEKMTIKTGQMDDGQEPRASWL